MEDEDIAALVEGFGRAAALAVAAGLDGVEVNAGQLSLLRQFLSGLTNNRDDGYGSDRLRLAREVLAAVRSRQGSGAVLGLRLGCDELAPWAGITPEASVALAGALAPLVDYVVAVRAPAFDVGGTRPDGHTEPGFALPLARDLRAALPPGVAVVTQGSLVDVDMAEHALAEGWADVVEMTRAQIADPDLVAKAAAGTPERIRPCILCNQRCQVRDPRNPIVSCVAEPSAGYETADPGVPEAGGDISEGPAVGPGVLVVGAGPAGLEAARVAALGGHRVTLVERDERCGGRLRSAAEGSGRRRLSLLVDWLEAECRRLGVEIRTSSEVTPAQLAGHLAGGGRVVVCTGSAPGERRYDNDGSVLELSADRLLRRWETRGPEGLPDGPVVIDDPVGDAVGISVAELLAAAGRPVALVTGDLVAGTLLSRTGDLAPANTRLARAGVAVVKRSAVVEVAGGLVRLEDRYTAEKAERPAALLVEAGYALPEPGPAGAGPEVVRAGDAVAPRSAYEAVLEGRRAALGLDGGPA
jgi:2,4-dienoyl-CoA reductase (NADPH2)